MPWRAGAPPAPTLLQRGELRLANLCAGGFGLGRRLHSSPPMLEELGRRLVTVVLPSAFLGMGVIHGIH
jgi:hypothetical protein